MKNKFRRFTKYSADDRVKYYESLYDKGKVSREQVNGFAQGIYKGKHFKNETTDFKIGCDKGIKARERMFDTKF